MLRSPDVLGMLRSPDVLGMLRSPEVLGVPVEYLVFQGPG
jgi:type IV secretory pathway VirB3-like protein